MGGEQVSRNLLDISDLLFMIWFQKIPPSVCALIGGSILFTRGLVVKKGGEKEIWELFTER